MIDFVSIAQALLVAEQLSFRRAADVLGIRQSAVSRRIQALEDSLGVSIFERHHGGVRLTTAGMRFLAVARSALTQLDIAAQVAGAAGRGENGELHIGICSSIAAGFLRDLIQHFFNHHSNVDLEIREIAPSKYRALLHKGDLDVAFTTGTPIVSGCETRQLWTERLFAVLPQEHPLATKRELDWESLSNERFILRDSDPDRAIEEYLAKLVSTIGRHPNIQLFDVGRDTALHLVALGLGLSLTTEATTSSLYPGVVFCPIVDVETVIPFSAVWSTNNDNPAFRRFLSLARAMSQSWNDHAHDATTRSSEMPTTSSSIGRNAGSLVSNGRKLGPSP